MAVSVVALAVLFCAAVLQGVRSQTCKAESTPCTCYGIIPNTNEQVTFDIANAFPSYPITVPGLDSGYDYHYSPCQTISCGLTTSTPANVCQESTRPPPNQFNAGALPLWTITNTSAFTITYTFTTGTTTRTTFVTFLVDPSLSKAEYGIAKEISSKYYFTISLPNLGGGGASGDISGYIGLIFISIIILAVIAYFVIGAVIMAKVKGAQGMEIIPNIAFWKDLPFLIKDGIMFVLSPCVGHRSSYTKM